jgi:hypothetical protein
LCQGVAFDPPATFAHPWLKGPIHDQSCCATLCVAQHDWSCMGRIKWILNHSLTNKLPCAKPHCSVSRIMCCRIWGFHTGGFEEYLLLGYDADLLARCFAELFYDPEDGGDTFLVGYHSTHYTASYPRRRYTSNYVLLRISQFYNFHPIWADIIGVKQRAPKRAHTVWWLTVHLRVGLGNPLWPRASNLKAAVVSASLWQEKELTIETMNSNAADCKENNKNEQKKRML